MTRRAFRRDVTAADVQPFMASYTASRQKNGFDDSISAALRDVLLAPDFLFRLEFDPPGAMAEVAQPVSDQELASRLSFFLWNSIPDDELLDVVRAGKLREPVVMNRELKRMLADPRASALADNFAGQWLGLRAMAEVKPDPQLYPEFDSGLAAHFEQETRLFLRSVIRENRSVLDVIGAADRRGDGDAAPRRPRIPLRR